MPIYQTAHYQVRESAVDKVRSAIAEFVAYVAKNEPGSRMYTAWQQKDDPTKFVHLFEFADEAAHQTHGSSDARFDRSRAPRSRRTGRYSRRSAPRSSHCRLGLAVWRGVRTS